MAHAHPSDKPSTLPLRLFFIGVTLASIAGLEWAMGWPRTAGLSSESVQGAATLLFAIAGWCLVLSGLAVAVTSTARRQRQES